MCEGGQAKRRLLEPVIGGLVLAFVTCVQHMCCFVESAKVDDAQTCIIPHKAEECKTLVNPVRREWEDGEKQILGSDHINTVCV